MRLDLLPEYGRRSFRCRVLRSRVPIVERVVVFRKVKVEVPGAYDAVSASGVSGSDQ